MDHLAMVLNGGEPGATATREAIQAILDDGEARARLVEGATQYAKDGFSQVASGLAAVLAAHPEYNGEQGLAALGVHSGGLIHVGHILQTVGDWDGGAKSGLPGLLTAGFGIALAGVGTAVTGGLGTIALAGVGAAAGVVGDSAQSAADQRIADRGAAHAQSVRDVAYYMAASSLLLNPGPPPLCDLLVETWPDPKTHGALLDAQGRFLIPRPGTKAWSDFQTWLARGGNTKLSGAVNYMLGTMGFDPGWKP
jgi:hypothetical protein